jgi:hypothetical protein
MPYYYVENDKLVATAQPPARAQRWAQMAGSLLPPIITELHRSLHQWGELGKRPGLLTPDRVWATPAGRLVVYFEEGQAPYPLLHVGMAPDLATWFVLLDKWMETFVVVARARVVWTPAELASAMTFVNPLWLPKPLLAQPPQNWLRVVRALASAVADRPVPDVAAGKATGTASSPGAHQPTFA